MVDFLSEEDETLTDSWIDDDDEFFFIEPTNGTKAARTQDHDGYLTGRGSSSAVNRGGNSIELDPMTIDFESLDDEDDSPVLDYTSSSDDNYEIGIDNSMEDLVDEIVGFPDSGSFKTHDEGIVEDDVYTRPFTERFESTVLKLRESMRRSSETRKSLVMKTSPAIIDTPDSVNAVIQRVEESTRFIQTSLCRSAKPLKVAV
jgi:hypothetical protein